MTYGKFAYLYDTLMEDVPYNEWVNWVQRISAKHGMTGVKLMDLACGTGQLSIQFSLAGFEVAGVDLSEDMLAVAQAKADAQGLRIPFFQQDMTELDGHYEAYDIIGIFCDSLNYLREPLDIEKTFAGVHRHLADGGLFFFDVHSLHKMDHIFTDGPFTLNDEDISYIWNSFPGDQPHSAEHELTFFVLDEKTGMYDRVDELHYQRTFEISFYTNLLEKFGFELLEISADFLPSEPGPESERILVAARKKE